MLKGASITSNHTRLLLQGLQNVAAFIGAVLGAIFTDQCSRRPQFLVSTGACVISFVFITAANITVVDSIQTAKNGSQTKAEFAAIFIFGM